MVSIMWTGMRMVRAWVGGWRGVMGLTDPPRRVGGELVAAAVLELLGPPSFRPMLPSWMRVEELQAAVRVLLGDRHDQAEVGPRSAPAWPGRLPPRLGGSPGWSVFQLVCAPCRRNVLPGSERRSWYFWEAAAVEVSRGGVLSFPRALRAASSFRIIDAHCDSSLSNVP